MKYWINSIGYGLPVAIRLTVAKEVKGTGIWRYWYGINDLHQSNWKKLRLILNNRWQQKRK